MLSSSRESKHVILIKSKYPFCNSTFVMPWANYDWLLHTTLGGNWLQYAVFFFLAMFLSSGWPQLLCVKNYTKNYTGKLVASYNEYFRPGTSTGSRSNGILFLQTSLSSNRLIETGRNKKKDTEILPFPMLPRLESEIKLSNLNVWRHSAFQYSNTGKYMKTGQSEIWSTTWKSFFSEFSCYWLVI